MPAPTPSITHSCEIVRVLDGDTIEVRVTSTAIVRLLDCWAPETHQTANPAEKPRGIISREHLKTYCKPGDAAVLQVPFGERGRFGDDMTMGRVLGYVWMIGAEKSLSEMQVEAGMAWRTKEEEMRAIQP